MQSTSLHFASLPVLLASALAMAGCGGNSSTTSGSAGSTSGTTTTTGGTGGATTTSTGGTGGGTTTTTTKTMEEGPAIPTFPTTYNLLAQDGMGIVPKPGFQAGYGIDGDANGHYFLVWTGNVMSGNPPIAFKGDIWTTGTFTEVTPGCSDGSCEMEADDMVTDIQTAKGGGQHIGFSSTSTDDFDGIEFTIDQEPLILDLFYDNKRSTARVIYINADKKSPSNPLEIPFAITAVSQ